MVSPVCSSSLMLLCLDSALQGSYRVRLFGSAKSGLVLTARAVPGIHPFLSKYLLQAPGSIDPCDHTWPPSV